MVSLRCLSPLVLALSLAAQPSQAQSTDLIPLLPVRPRMPAAPGEVVVCQPTPLALAQAPSTAPVGARQPGPLVLLNSRLLVGLGGLSDLNPQDIEKIVLYKGQNSGAVTPAQWRGLDANGIIAVTLKRKLRLKSQSLTQLGRYLQAKGPVSYTINGLPAASGTLRIANEAIEELKVLRTITGSTLSVRVYSLGSQPAKTYPPGTIMIRGTASR